MSQNVPMQKPGKAGRTGQMPIGMSGVPPRLGLMKMLKSAPSAMVRGVLGVAMNEGVGPHPVRDLAPATRTRTRGASRCMPDAIELVQGGRSPCD